MKQLVRSIDDEKEKQKRSKKSNSFDKCYFATWVLWLKMLLHLYFWWI